MTEIARRKIVVIGGGTGTSTVLSGLRLHPVHLSAVVSMADDGGSTGILRQEVGMLPPGDIRQCLLALSNADDSVKNLFGYRFAEGSLKGHNAGNLVLAALTKSTGSFEEAIAIASKMLKVEGEVIPVTLDLSTLGLIHGNDRIKVMGEHAIDDGLVLNKPREFFLEPSAVINSRARTAILEADCLIIGPGSLATSLIPALIVDGIREAIGQSAAKLVYVENLDAAAPAEDLKEISSYLLRPIDFVVKGEGLQVAKPAEQKAGDLIKRSAIRHNPSALAQVIMDYLGSV